jgi:hypothetical protein
MPDTASLSDLVAAAVDRSGVISLLAALGLVPCDEEIPAAAWTAYGLPPDPGVRRLSVAARSGSLDALLVEIGEEMRPGRAAALAAGVRARNPIRIHLFVCLAPNGLVLGTHDAGGGFRHLWVEPGRVRASDLDALAEMTARDGEAGLALALRQARALDRMRVTDLFFRDFRRHRDIVARAFLGVPEAADRERVQLSLLLLCRLTFLCFLQRRGTLGRDDRYLVRLTWREPPPRFSIFRSWLQPLFFESLNRLPEQRSAAGRALGDVPYLNGGLFEPHALEREHPDLDLPDDVVRAVFDGLLERYRFTSAEAGAGAGYGVDPEILGRVFEGLMEPNERRETGSFYTPPPVVQRIVREGLAEYISSEFPDIDPRAVFEARHEDLTTGQKARVRRSLERVRVLDPACGSGAFLLGALHGLEAALSRMTGAAPDKVRREIVGRSLHGVDLLDDAALLCSLRLWLALSDGEDEVRPLPNLDRRIRQGDALVEPLDLALTDTEGSPAGVGPLGDPDLRRAYRAVGPAARRYLESTPDERDRSRRDLARAEQRLAFRWIQQVRRKQLQQMASLRAAAADRDLFGEVPATAHRARSALRDVQQRARELDRVSCQLEEKDALPFFSFGIHFAQAGGQFDFIVSNPPWVRSHRWPDRLRRFAARQYEVCRAPGWVRPGGASSTGGGGAGQLDLSLLFLERASRLLAPGGVLAILVPAKVLRALYGAQARRMMLRDLELALIEDHSLDQRSIFRADSFTAVFVLRRPRSVPPCDPAQPSGQSRELRVRMVHPTSVPLEYRACVPDLPLVPGDDASPWIMAPPEVVTAMRRMQRSGPPLATHQGLRVHRGVMTGANDILVMSQAEPRLGDLCRVEAVGYGRACRRGSASRVAGRFRAHVETSALRPLVRGTDVDAFRYRAGAHVVWCHDETGGPAPPPPRMERYLRRHAAVLQARPGWRAGRPLGSIFRLGPDTLRSKVAWHDLSDRLRAVALPARVPFDGFQRELVPLNTVYFLPVASEDDALVLTAILNSMAINVFARAIAERAKDARFRFFGWTIGSLPLPPDWRCHPASPALKALSRSGHQQGGLTPAESAGLDEAVAGLYRLDDSATAALRRFDAWLRGAS